jgi:hypothetical protein
MKSRHYLLALALMIAPSLGAFATPSAKHSQHRPLTFANTVAFFHEALGRTPLKSDARTAVFVESEWKSRDLYNQSLIFIENADEDIEITFVMSGDEGMNWVNEFFDSTFFERAETESLFQLLNSVKGTRKANFRHFLVEISRWQPHHHEIVVLSLTPRR